VKVRYITRDGIDRFDPGSESFKNVNTRREYERRYVRTGDAGTRVILLIVIVIFGTSQVAATGRGAGQGRSRVQKGYLGDENSTANKESGKPENKT
jgi:hypothetical protein